MNSCEMCFGEVFTRSTVQTWSVCDQCGGWDFCKDAGQLPDVEAGLRRKLKKANRENENLRQVIKFQRDALGSLGEQFIKLSNLLKERDV